jgi:hypothetical protein
MAENNTKPTQISVPEYIDSIPDATRRGDAKKLIKLMQSASGEKPKLWGSSIVGFGSYHYKYATGREGDMPELCFSPRKSATVVYAMTKFAGADALLAKLGKHTISGGCLHIEKLAHVDQKVLQAMIAKSLADVRARHGK